MIDDAPSGYVTLGDGRAILRGPAADLVKWFDDRFLAMARDEGAIPCRFPATIAEATLSRAGYFEAFPEGATALGAGGSPYWMPPAVCYHVYEMLAGTRFDGPVRLTAAQTCFREADRRVQSASRLWEFSMREVVFIGGEDWVAAERARWSSRIEGFARDLRLRGTIAAAADPFFGAIGRGRSLMQQLKGLKQELQLEAGPATSAVASFNLHETFFGRRFELTMADGAAAHSGCAAFGLERWALAFLEQRGVQAAAEVIGGGFRG
jgi:seryl-tRNA synthetase